MMKRVLKLFLSIPIFSYLLSILLTLLKNKTPINENVFNIDYLESKRIDKGKSCILINHVVFKHDYDIAIIVPCFNTEKYIEQCFESLNNQVTHFKYQIIFVDDGSTDSTLNILKKLCSKCHNASVLHQNNQGAASARNLGIKYASSQYITFVDSDDYISDHLLVEKMLSLIFNNHKNDCEPIIVEYNFSKSNKGFAKEEKKKIKLKEVESIKLRGFACCKIYSSSLFSNICFPEGYNFEDTLNTLILFPIANKTFKSNEYGYVYQDRADNSTHEAFKNNSLIDTFYVTKRLLLDAKLLNLHLKNEYTNFVMRQVVYNFKRLNKTDEAIKKSIFVETSKLINSLNLHPNVSLKYRNIYNAIKNNNYSLCITSCSIIQ